MTETMCGKSMILGLLKIVAENSKIFELNGQGLFEQFHQFFKQALVVSYRGE